MAEKQSEPCTTPECSPAWLGKSLTAANLVLEGGAMRGQFTAGVLDFFMEQNLWCDTVIGTSAGALCGYNYAAGMIGRTCLLNLKYANDWRYLSLRSFAATGNACGREFFFHEVPEKLEPFDFKAFENSPIRLIAVSSNLETGEADYHEIKNLDDPGDLQYLISSSSMPTVSQIVEVDGKKLLDGGTCDSVALDYSEKLGANKHIVVLTQDPTYQKKANKLIPLINQMYGDYPFFVERLQYRHIEYNRAYRRFARLHEEGKIFVIQPQKPVTIGNMEKDQEKLLDLYAQGYEQAALNWDALQAYLHA